jgi:hypothetical protein
MLPLPYQFSCPVLINQTAFFKKTVVPVASPNWSP